MGDVLFYLGVLGVLAVEVPVRGEPSLADTFQARSFSLRLFHHARHGANSSLVWMRIVSKTSAFGGTCNDEL
jgi:hypothetical protein